MPAGSHADWPAGGRPVVSLPVVIIMPVTVNIPTCPVLHPGEPGPLIAIQAAVGPHPGLGGANPRLLIFQAAKFPRGNLP